MKKILTIVSILFIGITTSFAQTVKISGKVTSADDKEELAGASVLIKGTTTGVITDVNGRYSIDASRTDILVFSYIGFDSQEITVGNNSVINVDLVSGAVAIQEVVVTGMTQMDKRLFTGATTKLNASDIKMDGMHDISRALEGRSAGVTVQNVSGTFGTAPKIRVRGSTSIYGSSKPLWVVDGVIMDDIVNVNADDLSSGDAVTLISSAIAGLNPDDIESFQILKDGSATSIYGARAMAGVIVITTKKGRPGVTSVNYTGEYSMRLVPNYREFNIMNSQDQMGIYREMQQKGWLTHADVARRSESGVYGKMYENINTYDPVAGRFLLENTLEARNAYLREAEYRNTNWFDELFTSNVMHNHSLSLSNGTDRSSTYASVSVMMDPGWYKQSQVQRYTFNLNTSYNVLNNVTANILANGAYRKQKAPGTLGQDVDVVNGQVKRDFDINPYSYALNSSRALDSDTYYNSNYAPFNIMNELDNNNIEFNVADLKFQGELKWKVLPSLNLSALGAFIYKTVSQEHKIMDFSNQAMAYRAMGDATIRDRNRFLYTDPDNPYALPISVLPQGGIYRRDDLRGLTYNFRATAQWNKVFAQDHITNFFGGMEVTSFDRHTSFLNGWGMQYQTGEIPFYVYQFFKKGIEDNINYYDLTAFRNRSAAFFATATYSYKGRYTINGVYRYEGTNRLGKSRTSRWLPTWNISGAWNAHEEDFFDDIRSVLSHFTMKASYSMTAENPEESVTNSLRIVKNYKPYRPFASTMESGLRQEELENSELTYEKKKELNIGVDLGFLNNRINLVADWYTRNNFDLIGLINTQGVGGTINKMANIATMKSSGVEFTLSTKNIQTTDFSWTTDFTFAYMNTEITKLKSETIIMDLIKGNGFALEGYPNRGLYSYRLNGLDEDGIPVYVDSNGETILSDDIDVQRRYDVLDIIKYEGPSEPIYAGGLGNIFTYKNFRLNAFITYSFGNKIRLDPIFKQEYTDLTSMTKDFKNRWVVPGDEAVTNIPVIVSSRQSENNTYLKRVYNTYNYSDVRIADGGFIRMKEISLSYDFPKTMVPKSISTLSVKLMATNLFLIYADKKLNGQDPEFFRSGGVSAPVPKQFTLTLRLGL